ncbi:hypothetical protein GGQ67_004722 [Rhizobium metallidurans]|uniref:Uncharacterized protein n=1 Tax=Rhizobium metallidurans TaxID=1265931 RepID=A0A7W6GDL7_9HYPH|nr:hypothetical protein [Rhizobium metallidurans]
MPCRLNRICSAMPVSSADGAASVQEVKGGSILSHGRKRQSGSSSSFCERGGRADTGRNRIYGTMHRVIDSEGSAVGRMHPHVDWHGIETGVGVSGRFRRFPMKHRRIWHVPMAKRCFGPEAPVDPARQARRHGESHPQKGGSASIAPSCSAVITASSARASSSSISTSRRSTGSIASRSSARYPDSQGSRSLLAP